MKPINIFLVFISSIFLLSSCGDRRTTGGPCKYADISRKVKVLKVERDSLNILSINFQVLDDEETILFDQEDFNLLQVNAADIISKGDAAIFLLSGKENIVGTCQPIIWNKISPM